MVTYDREHDNCLSASPVIRCFRRASRHCVVRVDAFGAECLERNPCRLPGAPAEGIKALPVGQVELNELIEQPIVIAHHVALTAFFAEQPSGGIVAEADGVIRQGLYQPTAINLILAP